LTSYFEDIEIHNVKKKGKRKKGKNGQERLTSIAASSKNSKSHIEDIEIHNGKKKEKKEKREVKTHFHSGFLRQFNIPSRRCTCTIFCFDDIEIHSRGKKIKKKQGGEKKSSLP